MIKFANNATTVLKKDLQPQDNKIYCVNLNKFPDIEDPFDYFLITLENRIDKIFEICKVYQIDKNNNILYVERGWEDTIPSHFPKKITLVENRITAGTLYLFLKSSTNYLNPDISNGIFVSDNNKIPQFLKLQFIYNYNSFSQLKSILDKSDLNYYNFYEIPKNLYPQLSSEKIKFLEESFFESFYLLRHNLNTTNLELNFKIEYQNFIEPAFVNYKILNKNSILFYFSPKYIVDLKIFLTIFPPFSFNSLKEVTILQKNNNLLKILNYGNDDSVLYCIKTFDDNDNLINIDLNCLQKIPPNHEIYINLNDFTGSYILLYFSDGIKRIDL